MARSRKNRGLAHVGDPSKHDGGKKYGGSPSYVNPGERTSPNTKAMRKEDAKRVKHDFRSRPNAKPKGWHRLSRRQKRVLKRARHEG